MNEEPYGPLGRVLDDITRASPSSVRGPYEVADFIAERTETQQSGDAWSFIFHARIDWSQHWSHSPFQPARTESGSKISTETAMFRLWDFALVFKPSAPELRRLAYVFMYGKEPPEIDEADYIWRSYREAAAKAEEGSADQMAAWDWLDTAMVEKNWHDDRQAEREAMFAEELPTIEHRREQIEAFVRDYGLEGKEAQAAYYLRRARELFEELHEEAYSSGEDVIAGQRGRIEYTAHIQPHFMALNAVLQRRVLERTYPEGWGRPPGGGEKHSEGTQG
jgi:hypothetical protein